MVGVYPSNPHLVREELVDGWLTFQTERERRRYSPAPENWDTASDDQLRAWWLEAKPAPKPPEPLIYVGPVLHAEVAAGRRSLAEDDAEP